MEDALKEDPAKCPADLGAYRDGPLDYPPGAMRYKEEGQVVLGLCVAPDGHTETVEILKSSPFYRLNLMTALWACGKRREPARSADGSPVRSCAAVVDITWRLSEFDIPDHVLNPRIDEAPAPVPVSR
jgi:TonB family protein